MGQKILPDNYITNDINRALGGIRANNDSPLQHQKPLFQFFGFKIGVRNMIPAYCRLHTINELMD